LTGILLLANSALKDQKILRIIFTIYLCLFTSLVTFGLQAKITDPCEISLEISRRGKVNFAREWGVAMLRKNDPAFVDPEYIDALMAASIPGTIPFSGPSGALSGSPYGEYLGEFIRYFETYTDSSVYLEVVRFTQSGTEANNAFYEFAEIAYKKRTGLEARRVQLLHFDKIYGGTFGRIAEIGGRYVNVRENSPYKIPTPHVLSFDGAPIHKFVNIEDIENAALDFIRKKMADKSLEIGGIFIEPVSAFEGLYVFRPQFMKRLRALADELMLPIFADEILSGGGRTGKFWGFYHYEDFAPDMISFGKGLVVSGVAKVVRNVVDAERGQTKERWPWPGFYKASSSKDDRYPNLILDNTSKVNPLQLIQAIYVLKRIREGKLVENSRLTGEYLLSRLKDLATKKDLEPDKVRGLGLMIYAGKELSDLDEWNIDHYIGRWLPWLSLSRDEVDLLFSVF